MRAIAMPFKRRKFCFFSQPTGNIRRLLIGLWLLSIATLAEAGTWSTVASLQIAREFHTATTLRNGKVLVVGGYGYGGDLASAELYDPETNTWTRAGDLAAARNSHTATLLADGTVLVAGGYGNVGNAERGPLASAELYDPATNNWMSTGSLANARDLHSATLLPNGKVLVAAGYGSAGYLASAELYDPATRSWIEAGVLQTARYAHTATLLSNGKVLVAGGDNVSHLASSELYDPATNRWTAAGALAKARRYHTATLLPNGKVLVAGGDIGDRFFIFFLADAELYDPEVNVWTPAPPLAAARYFHTATILTNGKVLIAGGRGKTGDLTRSELYDATTNTWTPVAALATGRELHTAALLLDGKVLVASGHDNTALVTSAELFDPEKSLGGMTGAVFLLLLD